MSETTARLSLPLIAPAQAQKHVTHNEAIRVLDTLVQLTCLSASQTTPPPNPGDGDAYIVPVGTTDWEATRHDIALWQETGWVFISPLLGWRIYDAETAALLVFNGTEWTNIADTTSGASAYDIAVETGFDDTQDAWLETLVGPKGDQGEPGPAGPEGPTGPAGTTSWSGITDKPTVNLGLRTLFDSTLSSTTQNTNATSIVYQWHQSGVSDPSTTTLLNNQDLTIDADGIYSVFCSIAVTNGASNNRSTFGVFVNILDINGTAKTGYLLGTAYIRDDAPNYDSGAVGGRILLSLSAGDRVQIMSYRFDAEAGGANYADVVNSRFTVSTLSVNMA